MDLNQDLLLRTMLIIELTQHNQLMTKTNDFNLTTLIELILHVPILLLLG
jgi:hypothetical protein